MDLVIEVGAAKSKREAREFISGNAIKINGKKINDLEYMINDDFINNNYIIVKRGKKNYYVGKKN